MPASAKQDVLLVQLISSLSFIIVLFINDGNKNIDDSIVVAALTLVVEVAMVGLNFFCGRSPSMGPSREEVPHTTAIVVGKADDASNVIFFESIVCIAADAATRSIEEAC